MNEFFKFIVKFGFQKTERHSQRDSFGYIFGNITSKDSFPVPITFAVLDKYSFLEYYGNRTILNKDVACRRMFERLDKFAFDKTCNPQAKVDFLRKVPCDKGKLCIDEDSANNVVLGSQFTYVISDLMQPRFWYVSLVACYRDDSCTWHHFDPKKFHNTSKQNYDINYDIQLVNGNPHQSSSSRFSYHFSFEQQNILEMNLIFFAVYLFLVPMQLYAVRIQKHPVTKLFTLSLILEFISLCFILSYSIRFAISGVGNETFRTTGDIFDILSRTSFMLILLLLAKGWAVTRQQISKTSWFILMAIWIPYCAFHMVLYVWNRTEVDIISDVDEYQTWPGWLVLACRSCIMLWFLWELRNTMKYEHSTKKLDFLLHFGASSLVWFIYLPIVAIVALQVSPMWRYKLLLGITNSADLLGYCVMTGLLWPNRAGQYLLLAGTNYAGMDELDEFNEAPHIVHGDLSPSLSTENLSQDLPLDINGHIRADLLDDDDEDIVLSTDDLLTPEMGGILLPNNMI
ncbi:Transmembrane protein, partial [Pseudolycoriella hygida]